MCKPTKLTPQVHEALCRSIGLGAPRSTACKAAGIHIDTLHDWLAKAQQGRQPYLHLSEDLEKAEGERINTWLSQIENAAQQGTWTAAAWKLERLGGPEFAPPKQRVEMDGSLDVNVRVESLSDDELAALAAGQPIRAISPAKIESPGRVGTEAPQEDRPLAS